MHLSICPSLRQMLILFVLLCSTAWQFTHADISRPYSPDFTLPHLKPLKFSSEVEPKLGTVSIANGASVFAVPEVSPSLVWSPTYVNWLLFKNGALYLSMSAGPIPMSQANTLLKMDANSHAVLANVTFPSTFGITQLVPSPSYVWVVGIDQSDAGMYVKQLDPTTLSIVHSQKMLYDLQLIGVDRSEQLLLTSTRGSSQCVWYHATNGSTAGVVTGGDKQLIVLGGAIVSATQHILIADSTTKSHPCHRSTQRHDHHKLAIQRVG